MIERLRISWRKIDLIPSALRSTMKVINLQVMYSAVKDTSKYALQLGSDIAALSRDKAGKNPASGIVRLDSSLCSEVAVEAR